jgi:hypothetical protein
MLARLLRYAGPRWLASRGVAREGGGYAQVKKTCCPMMSRQADCRQLCWRIIGKIYPPTAPVQPLLPSRALVAHK